MVARLADRQAEAGADPLHEVYDFANWAAEQAPADSPLAILPVVAHAERWRPWRSYAVQHLWGALDHAINRIPGDASRDAADPVGIAQSKRSTR